MQIYVISFLTTPLSNPSKSGSTIALVISLALSGLKLYIITLSPSQILPWLLPASALLVLMQHGTTNSSVSSLSYAVLTAISAESKNSALRFTIAS